ncbi:hypothetical protein [Croceicoccus hydrothermalis]|uniref:hypothetical protein n=1 Tax=Croceicoccus hydrothermalis TaxID=2867964 RepID=UPI001EFA56E8|nr:hypothetical protein [Croceicoccus hydrothermalis]
MRAVRVCAFVALLLLAGCQQEPDFDTRYEEAEAHIRKQAREIDAELAANRKLRSETDAAAQEEPPAGEP